jgi:dienelactone hydrolase
MNASEPTGGAPPPGSAARQENRPRTADTPPAVAPPDLLAGGGEFAAAVAAAADHRRSFLHERYRTADLDTWLRATRARLLDLLHYSPPREDLRPELVRRDDHGDYVRETIWLSTAPWSRVPCDLLLPARPRGGRWPAPAVVALHCHGGVFRWGREKIVEPADPAHDHPALRAYRAQLYGGRGYANELARRGYVVAVIDAFYFGERRLRWPHGQWPEPYRAEEAALEPDSDPWFSLLNRAHREVQPRVAGALFQAGATWPGVFVWDDRRTIEYLQGRPEVDSDRIACIGLSVGGYRAAYLVAADERIRAAVAVGWMCGLGELWPVSRWPNSVGWVHYVPGLYQELDLPDVAALACPRPLLVIQGSRDRLFPLEGVERALARLSAVYAKAGVAARFTGRIYDAPHQFNLAMQDEAFAWLDRWLAAA